METDKITEKIIEMYNNNIYIETIIEELGIAEHEVRKILKEHKLDRKPSRFSKELDKRIAQLYSSGKTQKEICYTLLVSENGIARALKREGIKKRTSSECNRKFNRNSNYFDKIDTPNKAYILGLIYADGNNFPRHNSITISLQESDKAILEEIKKEWEYEGNLRFSPLNSRNPNHKNQYLLNLTDEHMSKRLYELGVVDNKSLKIVFPTFLPDHLLSHFIRGYFDGDGNIYIDKKRNKCQTQTVGTKDFCEHLSSILIKMGCKNNIKHPKQCNENTFIIQTSGNKSSNIFLSWIYKNADMKLERKYNTYLTFSNLYKPNKS